MSTKYSLRDMTIDLEIAKKCLNEKELQIIQLRFNDGCTLAETAQRLNLHSYQHVFHHQRKAFAKMKQILIN